MGSQIVGHDLAIEQQLIYYIAVCFLFVPPNCLLPCPFFSLPFLRLNPGGSDGSVCLQCRRPGFDSWVRKIPWRRKWQSTSALLPGKSHGWRSLIGYSPWGRKESDTTEQLHFLRLTIFITPFYILCWLISYNSFVLLGLLL